MVPRRLRRDGRLGQRALCQYRRRLRLQATSCSRGQSESVGISVAPRRIDGDPRFIGHANMAAAPKGRSTGLASLTYVRGRALRMTALGQAHSKT